jgi:NTP pyrophosphatase (non-canonical NTP hydrolase)
MMTANGLAKLIEECGELIQVAGKKLAYYHTDEHPDGKGSLAQRLQEEMGDVMAAIRFASQALGLDRGAIEHRALHKERLFERWHADGSNGEHSIERAHPDRMPSSRPCFACHGARTVLDTGLHIYVLCVWCEGSGEIAPDSSTANQETDRCE